MSSKQLELSAQAQELIKNPLFGKAFETVKQQYMEVWGKTKFTDTEAREKLFCQVKAIDDVKKHIVGYAKEGEAYRKVIEKETKRR